MKRWGVGIRASESRSYTQAYDSSRRESLDVAVGVGTQDACDAVIRILVYQERREIHEPTSVPAKELRMVERVVEERRELQLEAILREDILVESEVDDPGSRAFKLPFFALPSFPGWGSAYAV